MTRSFTGMLGRSVAAGVVQTATEQLTSFQVAPPSVVLKMWPVGSLTLKFELLNTKEKPEKVTYAVIPVVSAGSTAITLRESKLKPLTKSLEMGVHVFPASTD